MRRNRQKTEQRIVEAATSLLALEGFIGFGINAVAARSGSDKVLIYRYFNGLDGLLAFIGETEVLFPSAAALLDTDFAGFLDNYREAQSANALAASLHDWERVANNPLTAAFRRQRTVFWEDARRLLRPGNPAAEALLGIAAALPLLAANPRELNPLLEAAAFDPVEAPTVVPSAAPGERLADNLL